MFVVDTEKLGTAIIYLQRITKGHNPVNNLPINEDSAFNDPNVVRCMLFVKEVLEEIKRNDGYIGRRPRINKDPTKQGFPLEALESFQYAGDKSVSKLVDQINGLVDMTLYNRLTYEPITAWLKENGFLAEEYRTADGKKRTVVTDKGMQAGIKSEVRRNSKGVKYHYITYGRSAQELIVSNMHKILMIDKE